jgi:hypothetical protein
MENKRNEVLSEEFKRMQELAGLKTENGVELSDPELAVRWWGRRDEKEKQELLNKYLPDFNINNMNHQDIFWLWKKQQKL